MKRFSLKIIQILRLFRNLLIAAGVLFSICLAMAFTTLPFWGLHWLGTSKSTLNLEPGYIILLGGSGMPSESNLIRGWYTARAAKRFTNSIVIIAMPGNLDDQASTPLKMRTELMLRGVDSTKIVFEPIGANTRQQALECEKIVDKNATVLLVTSPEHMRRAILCFNKVNFHNISALPAFENPSEASFLFQDKDLGGNSTLLPNIGENMQLRYQVWNHLKYEIIVAREMMALTYYKLRGWI